MKHMDTVLMRQVTSLPLSKIQETEETCAGNMDNLKQNETNCCIILIFHFEKFLIYKAVKKIDDFESFSQINFSKLVVKTTKTLHIIQPCIKSRFCCLE